MIRKIADATAKLVVAGTILGVALHFFVLSEPVTYVSVNVVTPEITAGDKVVLHYLWDKHKSCKTNFYQFIVNEATGEAIWQNEMLGGYGPFGVAIVPITLQTEKNWPPGSYIYKPIVHYDCIWFTISGNVPPAKFVIRPNG